MKPFLVYRLIWKARFLTWLSKILKKGSGTSLPGISIEKRYQKALHYLGKDFNEIIFISGTNGKTTTRALLSHIYESQNVAVCSNLGGANLIRGIASSLLQNLTLFGKPKATTAIFEVEEASLPILSTFIQPNKLILTNIFRDQLDAYGEINKTKEYFIESIKKIQKKKKNWQLIINLEDGMLRDVANRSKAKVIGFEIDYAENYKPKYEQKATKKIPDSWDVVIAKEIQLKNLKTSFKVSSGKSQFKVDSNLPGIYNIYNTLSAVIASFDKFKEKSFENVTTFQPAFGRGETVQIGESSLTLFLTKNPAGFDQVLNLILENFKGQKVNLAICINDNIADGKDVSWLWDTSLEEFVKRQKLSKIYTSGTRGRDMLLRLEYAHCEVSLENNFGSIAEMLEKIEQQKEDFLILSTYTATLELRKLLSKKTELKNINSKGN